MLCIESGCVKSLKVGHQDIRVGARGENLTWRWSLSDRQASVVMVSGLLGARTVERDLPPNMREMGDSTELAYS